MATIEIWVTNKKTGQVKAQRIFETTNELAQALIEKIEEMIATLPPQQITIARTVASNGTTVVDIEVDGQPKPPVANPTFEKMYRYWQLPEIIEVNDAEPNSG